MIEVSMSRGPYVDAGDWKISKVPIPVPRRVIAPGIDEHVDAPG